MRCDRLADRPSSIGERWRPPRRLPATSTARRPSGSSRPCASRSRAAGVAGLDVRPRRPRGRASRAGCCTTTSARRSGCSPRSCAATATCGWRARRALGDAQTAEDVFARLVAELTELVDREPDFITIIFELFTLGRRNEEIAAEFAELMRRTRDQLAQLLEAKRDEGVLRLAAEPAAIADVLFAVADGFALRMVAEPERDWQPAIAAGIQAIAPLIAAP
jgi:hypothetical protein